HKYLTKHTLKMREDFISEGELCCSATIRFSAIVVFLAGLPSGRGQAVWKIIDQKVKSGFSRRWSYPIFCLPTDVFSTSNTKAHCISGAFCSMTAPSVVK